ncbi:putative uncharacterized protein DDB_G0293878 isoform X2 [Bradysia coprophila]|uniref:putative uncharacterized protein DDB_G0293878 isoform X2 n=1 Tax=Bradysia coprophila TaxID=38358 RepID=UPI00187DD92E|nr:putative uncharacterized protein DDB_G0293878 isoform X2 [Bradysia coprophila]
MATVFLSDLFQELFTKKTCIYLPHNHEIVNENCVVWETKYFFRKEVHSSRGKLRLESTPTNEKTDLKEENKNNDFKRSPVMEKLRPIVKQKKDENIKDSATIKAMMKIKRNSGRSNGQGGHGNNKNSKISDKSKILVSSTPRMNTSKMNSGRNNAKKNDSVNTKKYSNKTQSVAGHVSNVSQNVSQSNVMNSTNKYMKNSITTLDKGAGRKEIVDGVNPDEKRKTANRSRMTGGQLSQSENVNAKNRTGNMDSVGNAVRDGGLHAQNNNFNQISGVNHSEATSKITRVTGQQHIDNQNKNAGATLGGSTKTKSFLHSNAYDNDQIETGDIARSKYGIFGSSEYGVRSSFPSRCNKTNLVYDERQKTLNFGSQCTETSFFQDDSMDLDDKTSSKSPQTDGGIFVLKITTGRQDVLEF